MHDDEAKPGVAYVSQAAEPHTEAPDAPLTMQQTAPQAPQEPQAGALPNSLPLQQQAPQQPQMPPEDDFDDEDEDQETDDGAETALLSWNAPEFTATEKPKGWYALLVLFFAALIGLAIYTRQWITIGLFVLMGIAFGIYANRKPRNLNYTITTHGVHVGDKAYPFDSFTSFYEISDYGQKVLELIPGKRFGTLVSLPIPAGEEMNTEQLLGSVLPKVPARNDAIDRLLRTLRF